MYSPNLFPSDLYTLWNQDVHRRSARFESEKTIITSNGNGNINGSGSIVPQHHNQSHNARANSDQLATENRRYLRLLFAPPLLAYTAEYPGASSVQLDYLIQSTSTSKAHALTTTPLTQLKVDQLERIRNTGYNTIRPIGIDRTMEEIDYEHASSYNTQDHAYDEGLLIHTAENNLTETSGNIATGGLSFNQQLDTTGEVDHDSVVFDGEVSLSEEGIDEDDDDDEDEEEANDILQELTEPEEDFLRRSSRFRLLLEEPGYRDTLEDEGFMADEVEYQDDHSLNADGNQFMFINSGTTNATTNTTATVVSSNNMNSGRSATTNATTISSPLQLHLNSHAYSLNRIDENHQDENEIENEIGNENEIGHENEDVTQNEDNDQNNSYVDMVVDAS